MPAEERAGPAGLEDDRGRSAGRQACTTCLAWPGGTMRRGRASLPGSVLTRRPLSRLALRRIVPQDAGGKQPAQRAGEQRRQEHEVAHQGDREHREHHVAEPLRRPERREREDRQPDPDHAPALIHRPGTALVGEHRRLLAVEAVGDAAAEPEHEVDDVVDRHAEGHARGHHGADVDQQRAGAERLEQRVAPAHPAEHADRREGRRQQEHEPRRGGPAEQDHHRHDDQEVPDEADLEAVEQRVLGLVDQRHEAGVVDRHPSTPSRLERRRGSGRSPSGGRP